MRRQTGCLTGIVAFVVLARLGVLTPISDWLWHFGEVRTPWVRSPDGQWSAQVRVRALLPDNPRHLLFLCYRNERPKRVGIVGPSQGGLQWSSDSRRVAGASVYYYTVSYPEPWTVWVYDTVSKHEGDGWGEDTQAPSEKQMSERERIIERRSKRERITERLSKVGRPCEFKWRWRGAGEIVGYLEDYSTDSYPAPVIYPLFVYSIEETPSRMNISWRIAD